MIKVMVVFGTRPETIKMCPLVKELKIREKINTVVCGTGQHREMLDQVLTALDVVPNYDLSIMKAKQTLFHITINILEKMKAVLEKVKPDVVLVQGDTSTTFVTALTRFYLQIPLGLVEAGLKTFNIYFPYPEEFNKQAIDIVSNYNFSPTEMSRENLGEQMKNMFRAIKRIIDENYDIKAIYPIHMNPVAGQTAREISGDTDRIRIIEPLDVVDFHNFLSKSHLILTDSGGIQEEAPGLGKPVLVMRDTSERLEGIAAEILKLVGTDEKVIYNTFKQLLQDQNEYYKMSKASNPREDGHSSNRIADIIETYQVAGK